MIADAGDKRVARALAHRLGPGAVVIAAGTLGVGLVARSGRSWRLIHFKDAGVPTCELRAGQRTMVRALVGAGVRGDVRLKGLACASYREPVTRTGARGRRA